MGFWPAVKHVQKKKWWEVIALGDTTDQWGRGGGGLVTKSCPTLCDPMDCSPPASVHGIFQARILEWIAFSFCRGSSQPRNRTQVSCTAGRFFTYWAVREVHEEQSNENALCFLFPPFYSACCHSPWFNSSKWKIRYCMITCFINGVLSPFGRRTW